MKGDSIGERFIVTNFGESHGKLVGCIVEGCPAGLSLTTNDIQKELDLRKPGKSIVTTMRMETDQVEIMSGIFNGFTTGAPICLIIKNKDADSRSYEKLRDLPRPGHADYVAKLKYGGFNDYRGSGRFSGRLTATFVCAGAIAKKLIKETLGIEIFAYSKSIGNIEFNSDDLKKIQRDRYSNEIRCPDKKYSDKMKNVIISARKNGDSVGGIVECYSINVPVGLGEPIFGSLDGELSRALYAIPAVKGIEFGSGFMSTKIHGSKNNDAITFKRNKIITKTNNSGGIVGGISNGMPIIVRVAFKPPSSIGKEQNTINMKTNVESKLIVTGRHDPCVVPRAVPVVENTMAIILADHSIRSGIIGTVTHKNL